MASGTISKSITGRKYYIEWSSVGDISTNTSTITCKHYLQNDATYSLRVGGGGTCTCTAGSDYQEYTAPAIYTDGGQTHLLGTTTHTVSHNSDGTKSITITGVYAIQATLSGTWYGSLTATGTAVLDTIPRQANINTAPNFTDDDNPTITYTNSAGSSATTLQACISLDGSKADIAYRDISKTGSSYTFSLTDAERNVLRNATTTANSRTVYFYVKTVIGSNTFYSKVAKTLTIANGTPTLSPVVEDTLEASLNYTQDSSIVIKGYNSMKVVSGATARKNATITSVKITCGGKSITTTSGIFENAESGTFVFSCTDSRGNTVSQTITLTLIDYVKLTCNFTGNPPTTDGVFTFTVSGKYFPQNLGETANTLSVMYRYKGSGDYCDWITITPTLGSNYAYEATQTLEGLDYQTTYTFQAMATDLITSVETSEIKVKTKPVFDWSSEDFNFNVPITCDTINGYNITGAMKAMTTVYTYSTPSSVVLGDNYTAASGTIALIGNTMRVYFSATRSSAASAGNITDEVIATFTYDVGGKVKSPYIVYGITSNSNSSYYLSGANVNSDGTITLTLKLSGVGVSSSSFAGYLAVPIAINLDKY